MEEAFKDIPGYEGIYLISNHGYVYSVKRKKRLSNTPGQKYPHIKLYKQGKFTEVIVHIEVAKAFLGDKPDGKNIIVNHKDGNKHNPHVQNLEWITQSENMRHAVTSGLLPIRRKGTDVRGAGHPFAKLSVEDIINMRELYPILVLPHYMSQKEFAKVFNTGPANLYKIIRYQAWRHVDPIQKASCG